MESRKRKGGNMVQIIIMAESPKNAVDRLHRGTDCKKMVDGSYN